MKTLPALPIDDFLPAISQKIAKAQNLVITAAPGAGKTTRLPAALAKVLPGKVLVLEPRRMAAIAAAHRIAEEQDWALAKEVGYQVRFANKTSPATKLIFMTEALLARQMMQDPELQGVDLVILDEFHERSLHVDLALGLLRELQELGHPLKILVMSATLEAEKIATYLGNAEVISVPGKLFEMDIRYQKNSQLLQTFPAFYENLFRTVKEAQAASDKDILVFLPGVGEIDRASETIRAWTDEKNLEIVPLHGSLPLEAQRKALQKSSRQRIILSTNIAESSVTLDGVGVVIDSGLAKSMKQDHRTGFSRLELGRISLSSAVQRAGRSARQFPGICFRLWNKLDEMSFSKSEVPEIQRVDLAESLLFLSAQGVSDFHSFSWFEKPQDLAIQKAQTYLQNLSALDSKQHITALGKKILHFPLPVRLGKLMLMGLELNAVEIAADVAALLQEKDILKRDAAKDFLGDRFECDMTARWEVLQQFKKKHQAPREAHFMALQTVLESSQQILQLAQRHPDIKAAKKSSIADKDLLKELLLTSFTDRLCHRRGKSDRALMMGGRGVKLQKESLVQESEFFVALSGVETTSDAETVISLASGFSKELILQKFKDSIQRVRDLEFNEEKGQFLIREYKALQDLPLDEASFLPASSEEIAEKMPQVLAEKMDTLLRDNAALASWWERLQFLQRQAPQGSAELQAAVQELNQESSRKAWILEALGQACYGETKIAAVTAKDLVFYFESVFPANIVQTLRQELPDKIQVPSGSMIKVHYPADKAPYLEVRIQEIFGWTQTPTVYFGQWPITLHLLGPNYRPMQVTSNLQSFWQSGYSEVRKELRIKYPKHQWPEDPADGIAEAKGRRRN